MDKLSAISFTLFLIADCFAVAALCMPDWIVSNVGGSTRIGLLRTCMTIRNRSTQCFSQDLTVEWTFALIFIFSGCVCLTTALGLTVAAQWDRTVERYSRWAGFLAVILFCMGAILFPMGFATNEIGGAPLQVRILK